MTATHRRTSHIVDTLGVVAVVIAMVLGLMPGIALTAADAAHGGLFAGEFEIDGNITGAHDWVGLGGEQVADGTGNTDASFFKASMTEASYPNWEFESGANAPKADLHRLFVQTQLDPAGSFIWLGATRVSDQGNVQVTAEFNKSDLWLGAMTGAYRQVGDFYIRFNFPGSQGANVNAYISSWTGSAWGAETELDQNDNFRSAVGTLGADSREFVELEINLAGIIGGGGPLACGSFGSVSFRTEASGGNNNNNDPTLKDIAGPFSIDLDTCATVTVEKYDEEGEALQGAQFTLYPGANTAGTPVSGTGITNPCTTGADGSCSFGTVQPGQYTIDETVVPAGYTKDADLPDTFTVTQNTPVTRTYTDPRIPYTITVEPDGRNAVGNDHVFTVMLSDDEGGMADETLDLAWSGVGAITAVNGGPAAASCITDVDGKCYVTVTSDAAGDGDLTATFDTPYQNTVGSAPGNTTAVSTDTSDTTPYSDISDSATKVWVGYVATIAATATNLVGDAHTFTATVWEVDGEGDPDGVLAGDVTVTVSWAGPTDSTISSPTCVTDAVLGTCTFEVNSPSNSGPGTVTIIQLDGVIAGIGGQDDEALSVTTPTASVGGSLSAIKTWREYRASIDDDSTNPAGQKHTFNVTVEYSDDNGATWLNPGAGITVAWTGPTPSGLSHLVDSTCDNGTDDNGTCTIVVHSDAPGVGTVTVTAVDGDLLTDGGETADGPFDVPDVSATKTWLNFTVDVSAAAVNQVGEAHTFRVEVKVSDPSGYVAVPAGTKVTWSDTADPRVTNDTCSTGTGDDTQTLEVTETNICFITVNSSTPGVFNLSVTGVDDFQFSNPDRTEDVLFVAAGTSSKTWIAYRASIATDGVNLVREEHPFTATAEQNSGAGWGPVPASSTITVTSSGVGTIDSLTCETVGVTGACVVTVDSSVPGDRVVTVSTVEAVDAVDSGSDTADVSAGTNLEEGQSTSATKTWIAYRAEIEESATNLSGDEHIFTVTASQNDGSGWTAVPDGTTVGYSTSNDPTVHSDTCSSTTGGQCTITVDSSGVATVTVTVTSISAEDVDGDPLATVANAALAAAPDGSLAATKDWVAVRVTVEASAINVVGEEHVFTVDVEIDTPVGTIDAPDGTTVAISTGGVVGSITSQMCDVPGTTDGRCTVTVDSASPGELTVAADSVSFTYDSTTFTNVALDGASGVATGQDLTATKTWRDYRVSIEAHDLNRVREAHTFTVTIEQTDDGSVWTDAPDGTTATVGVSGTAGAITDGTCQTTGTVDGDCTVVVNSTTAGAGTVTVSAIAVDLPEEDRVDVSVDVTDDSASKTWAAFRASISSDSVNITGDSHDFTVKAAYTVDGSSWLPVPDGSVIAFSDNGSDDGAVGSTSGDTCDATVGGECTVTVTSGASGQLLVTVTGIDPGAITFAGPDGDIVRDFGVVTLADDAVGIAPGTDTDVAATKTWASYTLTLDPAQATNLLSGVDGDTERFHTITATLSSDDAVNAPVDGQTINVAISGDTGVIDSVESGTVAAGGLSATCVTGVDGTCKIVIFSGTSGQATLTGSYQATVGDSDPITIDGSNDAVKTWTTFRVRVTPQTAVNLVNNPHVFTVTVERSTSDGVWVPVEGAVPTIDVAGTNLTIDTSDCDDGTDANGECTVTVTSATVQAVTLTATHTESYDDYDSEVVGQSTVGFTDSGDKSWIDFGITVTPETDENLVDTDHVFTVTVTTMFPTEFGVTTEPVVGANPAIGLSGLGSIIDSTCDDEGGTDDLGQCTVTIRSSAPGSSTLTATYLGLATDDEEIREYPGSADKLWVNYELVLNPPTATNTVGDAHTFTATLRVDTGEGFGPAVGETLQFTVTGVGGVIAGGDVDGDFECVTRSDDPGTVPDEAGTCEIVINSDEAGATTVDVSYGAVVGATSATFTDEAVKQWVDITLVKTALTGDGFSDGDLIADPGGFPFLAFSSSDRGPKTAVFEYLITNPSNVTLENVVLTDDRLGTIDLAPFPDCLSLAPGESCTARASEQFDYLDATLALGGPITNVGVVTATGNGEEVRATDNATIALVAVQSSILIDLVKEVVVGAGDVKEVDGRPVISWSQSEYEAGVPKAVRYRFTVTNISNAPIIDVELLDPMISDTPIIAISDGVTLQPNESTVVDALYVLTVAEAFPNGRISGTVENVATVSGASETRDSFSQDTDEASVGTDLVFAGVLEKTGLDAGGLLPIAMLLIMVGAAVLWLDRRRIAGR
jgi:hypothetical protein